MASMEKGSSCLEVLTKEVSSQYVTETHRVEEGGTESRKSGKRDIVKNVAKAQIASKTGALRDATIKKTP